MAVQFQQGDVTTTTCWFKLFKLIAPNGIHFVLRYSASAGSQQFDPKGPWRTYACATFQTISSNGVDIESVVQYKCENTEHCLVLA